MTRNFKEPAAADWKLREGCPIINTGVRHSSRADDRLLEELHLRLCTTWAEQTMAVNLDKPKGPLRPQDRPGTCELGAATILALPTLSIIMDGRGSRALRLLASGAQMLIFISPTQEARLQSSHPRQVLGEFRRPYALEKKAAGPSRTMTLQLRIHDFLSLRL